MPTQADVSFLRQAGRTLRAEREKRHLTIRQVQEISGGRVPATSITRLEGGLTGDPSMRIVVELGKVYGLTPNEMAALYGWWP